MLQKFADKHVLSRNVANNAYVIEDMGIDRDAWRSIIHVADTT